jgi:hypothetical protein
MSALPVGCALCSTGQQDFTAQRDPCPEMGVETERIYVDHGLTGTNCERPGLREALAACRVSDTGAEPHVAIGPNEVHGCLVGVVGLVHLAVDVVHEGDREVTPAPVVSQPDGDRADLVAEPRFGVLERAPPPPPRVATVPVRPAAAPPCGPGDEAGRTAVPAGLRGLFPGAARLGHGRPGACFVAGARPGGLLGVERADATAAAIVDPGLAHAPGEIVPHRLEAEEQAGEPVDHVLAGGVAPRHRSRGGVGAEQGLLDGGEALDLIGVPDSSPGWASEIVRRSREM